MENQHPDERRRGCATAATAILVVLGLIFLGCIIFVGGCMGMFMLS